MINYEDKDALIENFRAALHKAEHAPSEEAVVELRLAAAPIMDQLRAEYRAAGNTDVDCTAMFRWLRLKLAQREAAANETRETSLSPQLAKFN
jgi:hypothetical protein